MIFHYLFCNQWKDVYKRQIQGRYMDGKYDKTPVPGKNLKLGIDIELQMLGERLLLSLIHIYHLEYIYLAPMQYLHQNGEEHKTATY